MNRNQKGFSPIIIILVLLTIAGLGAAGRYVWSKNRPQSSTQSQDSTVQKTSQEKQVEEQKSQNEEEYSSFSVGSSGKLTDMGKCKSGEVLFARIYNSGEPEQNYEYDCNGPIDAIQYVSVVLGQRTSSILEVFGKTIEKGSSVTLSNEIEAVKYSFVGERKAHGSSEILPTKYTIYEVNDGKDYFYALYWTGVGFQDEDYFLYDFNEMALKNWVVR